MELYGLNAIVSAAVEGGTVHAITVPPKRENYLSEAEWRVAYDEWSQSQYWVSTFRNVA